MGPARELKEKCETLKQSFFSSVRNRSDNQARSHHQRDFYCLFCCLTLQIFRCFIC